MPIILFNGAYLRSLPFDNGNNDELNRAAIVVDFGNGQLETRCVGFTEEELTGYEVLIRSGLPVEFDYQAGGQAVCRIEGVGCDPSDCFCACTGGGNCSYWLYWHLLDDEWQYSVSGAGSYRVRDGMVEGWRWGLSSTTGSGAEKPPTTTFAEICSNEENPIIVNQENTVVPGTTENSNLWPYIVFGFLVIILAGATLVLRRRSNGVNET